MNFPHSPQQLISSESSLKEFCHAVIHGDVLQTMEAASAEISYQQAAYHKRTGRRSPRPETTLWQYCEDLKVLIQILMNGNVPPSLREGFVQDVGPLMRELLKKFQFSGNIEQVFSVA